MLLFRLYKIKRMFIMDLWQLFAIVGLAGLILEMVIPSMFFLNLALAGFVTALFALFIGDWITLTMIYVVLSILAVLLIRPILLRAKETKAQQTGVKGDYIGQKVKVVETVTKSSGVISIYEERWEARTEDDCEIPAGAEAEIVKNDGLIFYVK